MHHLDLPDRGDNTRVILVRHTEPDEVVTGRCYGSLDVPLSDRGHAHAAELAHELQRETIDVVLSSPRLRATATADAIATRVGRPVRLEPRLRELNFGDLEGITYEAVEARWPAVWNQWMNAPTTVRFPGGESHRDLKRRVVACMTYVRREYAGRTSVLVTHGGVARTAIAWALRMADADIFRIDQRHGAINVIDWYDDFPVLRALNA
jgi:alpha-ribazole phosphatase